MNNLKELKKVAFCLERGIIAPDDKLYELCAKATIVTASLIEHTGETGQGIVAHILATDNSIGVELINIHPAWVEEVRDVITLRKDEVVTKFRGTAVYPLVQNVDLYVMYEHFLEHACSWCKQKYVSDINRHRCESSHMNRKDLDRRSVLPVDDIVAYWDDLPPSLRRRMFFSAALFLISMPPKREDDIDEKFVRMVTGDIDIGGLSGSELFETLEEATEYTARWKMVREPKDRAVMRFRNDYVAAMASAFADRIAHEYSNYVAKSLLGLEVASDAKILNKVPVISKPVSFCMDDIVDALESCK